MIKGLLFLFVFSFLSHAQTKTPLYVGLSAVDSTPPVGTPLGGHGGGGRRLKWLVDWGRKFPYATFMTPSKGILDPIRSKAMVVKNNQRSLLFISIDAVGVTIDVYQDLKKRLAHLNFSEIFISATHTHSGPGALSKSWVWQIVAMDRFNQTVYNEIINGMVQSAEEANANIVPAELFSTTFSVPEIHRNRRNKPGHMDSEARVLLAKNNSGQVIGGLVNFAIHGCALPSENLLFSADVSGGIERHMERMLTASGAKQPIMLFINGAEGDVTNVHGDADGIEIAGSIFAEKASAALESLAPVEPVMSYSRIDKTLDKARINLKKCGAGKKEIKIYIGKKALPRVASLWQIKLGDLHIFTFPGEPTTSVGFSMKDTARRYGSQKPWIFGLTNGHMGYFTTPDEYEEGGYETCVDFHGKNSAIHLLEAHEEILKASKSL
jgi:neutral ceramidase